MVSLFKLVNVWIFLVLSIIGVCSSTRASFEPFRRWSSILTPIIFLIFGVYIYILDIITQEELNIFPGDPGPEQEDQREEEFQQRLLHQPIRRIIRTQ